MEETTVYNHREEEIEDNRHNHPPPYSPSPNLYESASTNMGTSEVPMSPLASANGDIGRTNVGVEATNESEMETNLNLVGTNLGVVGTNGGAAGTNAEMVDTAEYPTVVVVTQISPNPAKLSCNYCHTLIVTRMVSNPTMKTHMFATFLCLIGCWPCVCVPYCMNSCNNANHYCPNCSAYLGTYVN